MTETPKKKQEQTELKETYEKRPKKYYLAGIVPIVFLAFGIFLFFITSDVREKRAAQRADRQYQALLPEAETFELKKIDNKAAQELLAKAGFKDISLIQVLEGKSKEKRKAGTILELCNKSGYGGDLTLLIGMNESKAICKVIVKEAPEIVATLTKGELDSFLEQFLYSRTDKAFWIDERVFGGQEIVKMESAPVTSREIVRMVNGCRQLADNLDTLAGGQEND